MTTKGFENKISWPGPSAEMRRGFLYRLWRISPGIFLEDFSGHFFPHKNAERKSGEKMRKKSGGSKNRIREESVLPNF